MSNYCNYVENEISYLNVSDPSVPRWPSETLGARWGDCKSMSVLLASMLEAIGAKTVLIDWYDPAKREGHQYVGVMVSDDQDASKRRQTETSVRYRIQKGYSRMIQRYYHGRIPDIRFREATFDGRTQLYLLLDAAVRPHGIPGMALVRPDLEQVHESREGQPGHIPNLR